MKKFQEPKKGTSALSGVTLKRSDYFGNPLEVGDLVTLRSGGPVMTVTGFTAERVCTTWFFLNASDASLAGAGLQSSFFPPKALVTKTDKQPA